MRRAFSPASGAVGPALPARSGPGQRLRTGLRALRMAAGQAAIVFYPNFTFCRFRVPVLLMNTSVYRSRVLQTLRFPGDFLISPRIHYVNLYLIIVEIEMS